MRPTILLVDDEPDLLDLMELTLVRMGLDTVRASGVAEAKRALVRQRFDLCLTDMRLGDGDGLAVVECASAQSMPVPVAVITAFGSADNAVAALKAGAFDYLSKPVSLEALRALVRSALKLGRDDDAPGPGAKMIGDAAAMQEVRAKIAKLARSQAPVHVSGESGTGKELAARQIHEQGPRVDRPFIAVNCGAIPETLMESEFFGYRRGAFTGADADREGYFQAASGGTLFLDEVAELPLAMQVKLLRALQDRKVRRLGGMQEEDVDVRIVSATHQKLGELVTTGRFRQDLYYRLNVIELALPALRERKEDIPQLARAMLDRLGGDRAQLAPDAELALLGYDFPGNVRELENIIERALALCEGDTITAADLDLVPVAGDEPHAGGGKYPLQDYLDRIERGAILEALGQTGNNKTAAARLLGISFRSLRYRLERLGID